MKYRLKAELPVSDHYGYSILNSRGIEDIDSYIDPKEDSLCDYMLLDNILTGAQMLIKHIKAGNRIFILPDCDQDGIASAAILWNYIERAFPNADLRFSMHKGKQHGLTQEIIEDNPDVHLFVVPDAGSNQTRIHKLLKERNIDLLIIDHHMSDIEDNNGAVIINNQLSPNYPNKSLCGAAMVLKFCMALDDILGHNYAEDYYDLAAIGLVGDMMDLKHLETRYIVRRGLSNIKNPGLKALITKQSFSIGDTSNITPVSVAFYIAPLVNAMLRVGKPEEKEILFRAFIEGDVSIQSTKRGAHDGETETIGVQNARNCTNARARQNRIKDKAIEILDMRILKEGLDQNQVIVVEVEEDELDSTLTGLVAAQLMGKYKKPVIVARMGNDGCIKGSGRNSNVSEFNDFRTFLNESGFVDFAEGHSNAFGVAIKESKIDDLISYANETLKDTNFMEGVYEVDYIFDGSDTRLAQAILDIGSLGAIWGQGVEEPKFAIENIKLIRGDTQAIGADKTTFKFTYNGVTFIKFKNKELIEKVENLDSFSMSIVGRANINEWNGIISPQIMIEDYEIIDTSLEF